MKYMLLLIAFIAAPAAAQTTHCTRLGNSVDCTTDNSTNQGQTRVDSAMQNLVDSTRPPPDIYRAPPSVPAQRSATPSDPTYPSVSSKERRKAAYAQVGALIAKGDCDAAARLAEFYRQADLIDDTAKACKAK